MRALLALVYFAAGACAQCTGNLGTSAGLQVGVLYIGTFIWVFQMIECNLIRDQEEEL